MRLIAVILAAGQGTRMKSDCPKVLHPLAGQPLVQYAVQVAQLVTGVPPVLVVGHGSEQVRQTLGDRVRYVVQERQLGTGHAVLQARELLVGQADAILVSYADMPLLTVATLRQIIAGYQAGGVMSFLTVLAQDPRGFGRVVRDAAGRPLCVVEEASCTPEQLTIRELNAGVYCFNADWLWQNLPQIPLSPKGEYYLTDTVALATSQGLVATAVQTADESELIGINTRVHLAEAEQALRARVNRHWMLAGVTLLDPATTYIEPSVTLGRDTTILPNTHLCGTTAVGAGCHIGPNTMIVNSQIGDGCVITMSAIEGKVVAAHARIGPFEHVRG
jgi:bifunctional UDP-N-acetylglucosamine pyrophosphorylase/glucosamine-1-phosphate N-acetyltransferase